MPFVPPTFPERFNLARYLLDERVADPATAERIAIVDDDGPHTYRQVHADASRVARVLWSRGVRPEDRVLIVVDDSARFAAALFGVLKIGAVVTMANPDLPDEDYAYYLGYTRARAVVVESRVAARPRVAELLVQAEGTCHTRLLVGGDHPLDARLANDRTVAWAELALEPDAWETYDTSKDDLAIWLFTSGSTGKPKAAVHMHHDFAYSTECYAKGALGMTASDLTLSVPKLYFGYATGSNLFFPFAVGGTAILFRDKATPERLADLTRRHRATLIASVPTMITKMCALFEAEPARAADVSSLRGIVSAGEALPAELYHRWKRLTAVEIFDGIGSAELFHIYITNRPGDVAPGTLGKIVDGYEARLVGPDGQDVPASEVGGIGTLWVKGDSAALCYWQAHERSKEVLRGDWVVSGDLFSRDADGRFRYVGRADDLLKVGGIFVSPLEVEGVLVEHPSVGEACVVGYEDDEGLVKAMAYVVLKAGHAASPSLAESIVAHAKSRLAHYKAPRRIEFVAELPRSDRGKVLRRVLRSSTGSA